VEFREIRNEKIRRLQALILKKEEEIYLIILITLLGVKTQVHSDLNTKDLPFSLSFFKLIGSLTCPVAYSINHSLRIYCFQL
jgi:hypothetical protein